MTINLKWLLIVPVIVVLLWALSAVHAIGVGQVGVVTQFGAVTGRQLTAGLAFTAPWPFQSVTLFDTRIQKDQAVATAASNDLQTVNATLALNYNLDPDKVFSVFKLVGPDYKQRIVDPAIQETFKAISAEYSATDLIQKRTEVKNKVVIALRERLEPKGVTVDDVSIVNFNFSKEFNDAIEQKQIAQQKAEQAQFVVDQAQKQAEAQALQQQSLTPELLEKYAIDKWNGIMPNAVGVNGVFGIPLSK